MDGGLRDGQRNGERVGVVSVERATARCHLEHDRAEGEDIATRVRGVALKDLRGGIGGDGLRLSLRDDQLQAGSVDRNVRWGEGAERTAFVMYLTEGLGQQCSVTQSLRSGKWSFGQPRPRVKVSFVISSRTVILILVQGHSPFCTVKQVGRQATSPPLELFRYYPAYVSTRRYAKTGTVLPGDVAAQQ